MAKENAGGPAAQARARTIFPNTGGSIIGGIGTAAIQTGPQLVVETRVVLRGKSARVLPLDLISAKLDALAPAFVARFGEERVAKMREGQAARVLAFKTENAPDDDRAVLATPRPAARAATPSKKK